MNTVGIVLVSILAGLFLALIVALATYILWQGYQLRKSIVRTNTAIAEFTVQMKQVLTEAGTKMDLLQGSIRATLESHQAAIEVQVAKINGDKLAQSADAGIRAAGRIEKAAGAFAELTHELLAEDAFTKTAEAGGLKPGDYAPEDGDRHVGVSRVAAADAAAMSEEGERGS